MFITPIRAISYSSVSSAIELLKDLDLNVLEVIANGVDFNKEPYDYEAYVPDKEYLESV